MTPQTQEALDRGLLEAASDDAPVGAPEPAEAAAAVPVDFARLSIASAIEHIDEEDDPKKLEAIFATEKREPVIDALARKIEEMSDGGTE